MAKVWAYVDFQRQEIEVAVVVAAIEANIITCEQIIEYNGAALDKCRKSASTLDGITAYVVTSRQNGNMVSAAIGKFNPTNKWETPISIADVEGCNTRLLSLIERDRKMLHALNNDIVYYGQFMWQSYGSVAQGTYCSFQMGSISETEFCPICGGVYSKSGLTSHMGSLSCLRDKMLIDVKSMDYEEIQDSALMNAIRKSGVDYQVRPVALHMWAPAWVVQAATKFKESGFADMKLSDFLAGLNQKE
jgi:hypothetical protein